MRVGLALLLLCGAADAAELRGVEIDKTDGMFMLRSAVWFDARQAPLYAVFLNYDLTEQFTRYVVESRNLPPGADGRRRFYIRNEGCVWFYCKSFERTGWVDEEPHTFIQSTADAAMSDFESSVESWTFTTEGRGTLVEYTWAFQPKFWIPPLIGPYILKRKLERDSTHALNRIEAIARGER